MPPLGHRTRCRTLVSQALLRRPYLLCGAGTPPKLLRIATADLLRITGAEVFEGAAAGPSSRLQRWGEDGNGEARFVVDHMLCKLVRWMRCAGLDTVACAESMTADDVVALALAEQRVLLTCSRRQVEKSAAVPHLMLTGRDVREQFADVVAHYGLRLRRSDFMSRCTKCNGFFRAIAAADARARVPVRKADIQEFWECLGCGQVVWKGTQYRSVMATFAHIYGSGDLRPGPPQAYAATSVSPPQEEAVAVSPPQEEAVSGVSPPQEEVSCKY